MILNTNKVNITILGGIEFEPAKSSALCISLKRDLEPLVMDGSYSHQGGRDIVCVGVPF